MKENLVLLQASSWDDYELIDVGGFEKLERFGKYITIRPEPQAIWDKILPESESSIFQTLLALESFDGALVA